jgi:hypothetical protein
MEYTFYKIHCSEPNIDFTYIGSTKNISDRRWAHKSDCNNINKPKKYNLKLYKTIRENGGWDNWNLTIIGKGIYEDRILARIEEQKYINDLNSNLNSFRAIMTKEDEKKMKDDYVINNHYKVL